MRSGPILDVCPNCGAPLETDEDGKCRWCRAHVRVEVPRRDAGPLLTYEHAVQAYVSARVPRRTT